MHQKMNNKPRSALITLSIKVLKNVIAAFFADEVATPVAILTNGFVVNCKYAVSN